MGGKGGLAGKEGVNHENCERDKKRKAIKREADSRLPKNQKTPPSDLQETGKVGK